MTASAEEHPDLFCVLKGGSNNLESVLIYKARASLRIGLGRVELLLEGSNSGDRASARQLLVFCVDQNPDSYLLYSLTYVGKFPWILVSEMSDRMS